MPSISPIRPAGPVSPNGRRRPPEIQMYIPPKQDDPPCAPFAAASPCPSVSKSDLIRPDRWKGPRFECVHKVHFVHKVHPVQWLLGIVAAAFVAYAVFELVSIIFFRK